MAQSIAIIDYGSGNLRSVEKAFERAAREHGFACRIAVTDDPAIIRDADRIVLPGVGAFGACMSGLAARDGVLEALEHAVLVERRPFLGVCVGMQLLAELGLEFGSHDGLGWIPGKIVALEPESAGCRSPHMGWNTLSVRAPHPLLTALDGETFYFAHSYHFEIENEHYLYGVTDHGRRLAAVVGRDNIIGAQFHPEKSQRAGLAFIANYINWTPA